MTTYPLPTLACTIDDVGITKPSYADVLASLQASFRSIYGSDVNLDPDTQDGQLLAIFAAAINDCNNATIAAYNSFSPTTARTNALSSLVKINGMLRHVPSKSTVDVAIVGEAGTIIRRGIAADQVGNRWKLPTTVTIPIGGSITVTAEAEFDGDVETGPATVTKIVTPTRGWQTVNNVAAAVPGAPVEADADLRRRQSFSTSKPSQGITSGILAEVANLEGVQRAWIYENDTDTPDGNGIPAHSISVIAEGGDAQEIADAIALKKPSGTGTYGTTTETTTDAGGINDDINFYAMTADRIVVEIDLTAIVGYVSTTGELIKQAVAAYIGTLKIGDDVLLSKIWAPASLFGGPLSATFDLTAIRLAKYPAAPAAANVVIAFNEGATCDVGDITLFVS